MLKLHRSRTIGAAVVALLLGTCLDLVSVNRHASSQVIDSDDELHSFELRNLLDLEVLRSALNHSTLRGKIKSLLDSPSDPAKCVGLSFEFKAVDATSGEREYTGSLFFDAPSTRTRHSLRFEYMYDGTGLPSTPPDDCSITVVSSQYFMPSPKNIVFSTALEFEFLRHVLLAGREQLMNEISGSEITALRMQTIAIPTIATICLLEARMSDRTSFLIYAQSYPNGSFGALGVRPRSTYRGRH